jgi:leucyl-tRNA synthetase
MSKRWYNVVNPDEVIAQYGADCFRMYEMFLGPLEDAKPWNTKGIEGVYRFLVKFWGLYVARTGEWLPTAGTPSPAEQKVLHTCLKKVRQDLDGFNFNTTVAAFMIAVNDLRDLKTTNAEVLEKLAIAIAPFAPHLADELWSRFGHTGSIHKEASFPAYEEKYLVASEINYPVSINGKHRSNLIVPTSATQAEIEAQALALPETLKWTTDKEIAKIIFVKNKMVNIVVK